jgi:Protein of unknown function (DUF642)/PEP-CTERM motif
MYPTWRFLVFAGIFAMTAVSSWSAPVVQNPSFELNVLTMAMGFEGDATTVPNWTHTGAGDGPHWAIGFADGGGSITTAGEGNQFVTMGGGGAMSGTGTWSQNVSGFIVGVQYVLSFMLAAETTTDLNQVVTAAIIDSGTQQQNFTAPATPANYWRTWQTFNLKFTANATTEQILFSSTTLHDVGLDNVSITQAPEPGTCALFGAGLAALAILRRRLI